MKTTYRDLTEFGLPFITPGDPEFTAAAEEIRNRPAPFPQSIMGDLDGAAVLVNQSRKIVVLLGILWKYTSAEGPAGTNYTARINSSRIIDVLLGFEPPAPYDNNCIFPGSKRLITERGVWGDNTDVAPQSERLGGGVGFGGGGGTRRSGSPVERTLQIDLAIFEDGLCAGPDDIGLFGSLVAGIEERRALAHEAARALHAGKSRGQVFEMLQPVAKRQFMDKATFHQARLSWMFANEAIRHLVEADDAQLRDWFERAARPSALALRRV